MRKALILFIFVTLSIGIFAKAGIYGLDFNQSLDEADKKLSNNSFTQFKKNGLAAVYKRTKPSTAMVEIDLDSDTGKVIRWYATYDLKDAANVRDSIFSMVKGIHGTYDFWDDIEDVYVWDNYDGTAIYVFPAGDNLLVVEYSEWDEYYNDWEDYFW